MYGLLGAFLCSIDGSFFLNFGRCRLKQKSKGDRFFSLSLFFSLWNYVVSVFWILILIGISILNLMGEKLPIFSGLRLFCLNLGWKLAGLYLDAK